MDSPKRNLKDRVEIVKIQKDQIVTLEDENEHEKELLEKCAFKDLNEQLKQ